MQFTVQFLCRAKLDLVCSFVPPLIWSESGLTINAELSSDFSPDRFSPKTYNSKVDQFDLNYKWSARPPKLNKSLREGQLRTLTACHRKMFVLLNVPKCLDSSKAAENKNQSVSSQYSMQRAGPCCPAAESSQELFQQQQQGSYRDQSRAWTFQPWSDQQWGWLLIISLWFYKRVPHPPCYCCTLLSTLSCLGLPAHIIIGNESTDDLGREIQRFFL